MAAIHSAVKTAGVRLLDNCLARPCRPYWRFAEEEIVPARGPRRGRRFRCSTFPAIRHWFDALDSRRYLYHVATGPTQSGKTLCCFIIPVLFCLFELNEDVIVGVPHGNMASDKWKKDIEPALLKTRYAKWLPRTGIGSGGGIIKANESLRFGNGVSLTFMSFGGDDKSRAGETARNLIITETDGGQVAATTSDEDNPISQLVQRVGAFDLDAFIVMECTVSTTNGETWTRYQAGTATRLVRPCPYCAAKVSPEREDFGGWQGHDNAIDAGDAAAWSCPACKSEWTEEERYAANARCEIVHRGQEVTPAGDITGTPAKTDTFGFRWSAVDNPFRSARNLGRMEHQASRRRDVEAAKKNMDQFQYAVAWRPPEEDDDVFDPYDAAARIGNTPRNVAPFGTTVCTVGVDVRKRQLHYVVKAWSIEATCRVITYGTVKVLINQLGEERANLAALRYLRDKIVGPGWTEETTGEPIAAHQVWIDAGWEPSRVYNFIAETDGMEKWHSVFRPCVGRGAGKQYRQPYRHPERKTRNRILFVGDEFYMSLQSQRTPPVVLVIVNADHWKAQVHARWLTPLTVADEQTGDVVDVAGGATLFIPETGDHNEFCRHLAAEVPVRIWVPDKGETVVWRSLSKANHYFDASYVATAAARFCGVEPAAVQIATVATTTEAAYQADQLTTPDGRQFYNDER